jgi:hypothetical protein
MRICLGTDSCNIQICQEELDISERVGNFVRYFRMTILPPDELFTLYPSAIIL